MRSTFKIIFYVKKGIEKPNVNLPLMCRLTVDGEVMQFSCKMDVSPRLWNVKNGRSSQSKLVKWGEYGRCHIRPIFEHPVNRLNYWQWHK